MSMDMEEPVAARPDEGRVSPQPEVVDDPSPSQHDNSVPPPTTEAQLGDTSDMDIAAGKQAETADDSQSAPVREPSPPPEDDLAPLPKEFDPDAPTPVITSAPLPDDDLAFRREPTPEPAPAPEAPAAEEHAVDEPMDVEEAEPYLHDSSQLAGDYDRAGVLTAIGTIQEWPAAFEEEEAMNEPREDEPMNEAEPTIEEPVQEQDEAARRRSPSCKLWRAVPSPD